MPVLDNVEETFAAILPDLPIPIKTTLPLQLIINSQILLNLFRSTCFGMFVKELISLINVFLAEAKKLGLFLFITDNSNFYSRLLVITS